MVVKLSNPNFETLNFTITHFSDITKKHWKNDAINTTNKLIWKTKTSRTLFCQTKLYHYFNFVSTFDNLQRFKQISVSIATNKKLLKCGVTRVIKFWQINEVTMIILHVKEWCKLHPSVERTYFLLLSLNEETAISVRPQVDVILWRHLIFDFKLN